MKKILRCFFYGLIIFFSSYNLSAQAKEGRALIDSLELELKKTIHDTLRCNILSELSELCEVDDIPKYALPCKELAEKNARLAKTVKEKKFYLTHLSNAYNNMGILANEHGNLNESLEYYQKAAAIQKDIDDKKGYATSLNNIGYVYKDQGNISKALEYYFKALKIQEQINDERLMAFSHNNIGLIYKEQEEYAKALESYQKALQIAEKIHYTQAMSLALNNIGAVYNSLRNFDKGLEYYQKAYELFKGNNYKKGEAGTLSNIGYIYWNKKDFKKALEYYNRALVIQQEIEDKASEANTLNNIANVLVETNKANEAYTYAFKGYKLAGEVGHAEYLKNAANTLKDVYVKQGNFKEAFKMYEMEMKMQDSILSEENKKASIKSQIRYEYEKKAAADSVKNAEAQKVKDAQFTAQEATLKKEKVQRYSLIAGLLLVLGGLVFAINRFRVTQKQKQIIEEQKIVVDEAFEKLHEKNTEIMDSINYAERIQRSFLATKELLDGNLREYFVFFQPKDIVSGDFYWAATVDSKQDTAGSEPQTADDKLFYLLTADSTGHGVPGAIMSILNISSVEKAIGKGLTQPAEIFNDTRSTIIERLKKDGSAEGGKDGMDCSLLSFDFKNNLFTYAAANNPIWIVRGGFDSAQPPELIELRPDKMPVGKHDKDSIPFTQHQFNLQKGDVVYTLTDGLPDQFGGPKGKKFMYRQLKEKLLRIYGLPMAEQHELLKQSFNIWKGDLEQVDDVTIIGIRV